MSTEDTITEEATQWFLRLREGLSEAEQRRFAEWRAMSPEHARAYAKVERLWAEMAAVARASPALRAAASEPAAIPMTPPRRGLRPAGYALAASVMLAVAAILVSRAHLLDLWVSDHYTASGEQRAASRWQPRAAQHRHGHRALLHGCRASSALAARPGALCRGRGYGPAV